MQPPRKMRQLADWLSKAMATICADFYVAFGQASVDCIVDQPQSLVGLGRRGSTRGSQDYLPVAHDLSAPHMAHLDDDLLVVVRAVEPGKYQHTRSGSIFAIPMTKHWICRRQPDSDLPFGGALSPPA